MKLYILFLCVMSVIAFILYGSDKSRAERLKWRIPEKTLLLIGLCGGGVGALVGMNFFHHKTRKYYFYIVNIIGIIWQTSLLIYMAIK